MIAFTWALAREVIAMYPYMYMYVNSCLPSFQCVHLDTSGLTASFLVLTVSMEVCVAQTRCRVNVLTVGLALFVKKHALR